MIQIAIMSSDPDRRSELDRRLRSESSVRIAGVTPTFAFLRSLLDDIIVDVVVVDLAPDQEPEVLRQWLDELLDTVPLVALIAAEDTWLFNQMIRAEKGALLNRQASAEQIVHAIRAVSAGLVVFDSSLVRRSELDNQLAAGLTPREVQVLRLLAEGLVNREIAERLGISEHTIKFHIASILGKLQASSRTEAVTRGLRAGLIEL